MRLSLANKMCEMMIYLLNFNPCIKPFPSTYSNMFENGSAHIANKEKEGSPALGLFEGELYL